MTDELVIADRKFSSRLMVGTGKFKSSDAMVKAVKAAGAEIVTVALRRVDLDAGTDNMLDPLNDMDILLLPNTSGAQNADEAIRLANIARMGGMEPWIKLEVTPNPRNLLPDPVETLKAAKQLVKEGFNVLPYIPADPILARKLEDAGCATVMPLGSPIGTGMGLKTYDFIKMIIEEANIPVVVDAGIGLPSHAACAMELGADAVLVNTAMALAKDPENIALAFAKAVQAGRMAFLSEPSGPAEKASASSPMTGFLK